MARIEWVALRLNNWALWKDRERSGGLGYATQSVLLAERVDRYRESDIRDTIDQNDAERTDRGVQSMRGVHDDLHRTLHWFYLEGCGIKGTAQRERVSLAAIHDRLGRADVVLRNWFNAQDETAKREAAMAYHPQDAWDNRQAVRKFMGGE